MISEISQAVLRRVFQLFLKFSKVFCFFRTFRALFCPKRRFLHSVTARRAFSPYVSYGFYGQERAFFAAQAFCPHACRTALRAYTRVYVRTHTRARYHICFFNRLQSRPIKNAYNRSLSTPKGNRPVKRQKTKQVNGRKSSLKKIKRLNKFLFFVLS